MSERSFLSYRTGVMTTDQGYLGFVELVEGEPLPIGLPYPDPVKAREFATEIVPMVMEHWLMAMGASRPEKFEIPNTGAPLVIPPNMDHPARTPLNEGLWLIVDPETTLLLGHAVREEAAYQVAAELQSARGCPDDEVEEGRA